MKQLFLSILGFSVFVQLAAQEDTAMVIPRSVDIKLSYAPGYVISSSSSGSDPYVFPALAAATSFQGDVIWDGFISYRAGYAFQQFETAYNTTIASETRRSGVSSIDMHSFHLGVGQAQYLSLSRSQNDLAFVITPWAGLRGGWIQQAWGTPTDIAINGLDTTVSGFHSAEVFEADSLQGYSLQRLSAGNELQFQIQLSIAFEVRFLERFHAGLEPFVNFGIQPLYEQEIVYTDRTIGATDAQGLLSRGTNYGVRFSLRFALWQERL